jgi:hypothetical protein
MRPEALLAFELFHAPLSAEYSIVMLNMCCVYKRKFANVGFCVIVLFYDCSCGKSKIRKIIKGN